MAPLVVAAIPITSKKIASSMSLFFGVQECRGGLHPKQRLISDLNNISTLFLKSPSSSITTSSIKDCRRLGKFLPSNNRPRPILVHFNSCSAVLEILANRSSFSPFIVKPDLSPTARTRDKILLKERWKPASVRCR